MRRQTLHRRSRRVAARHVATGIGRKRSKCFAEDARSNEAHASVGEDRVGSAGVPASQPSDVSRDELLRELQLPADAKLIGVVDRLTPENRVKDLIWAADLLRALAGRRADRGGEQRA